MAALNCDIFIPVRLNSSRLSQKHLQLINGKPALKHLIERLQTCKEIRQIIVCTTNDKTDNLLIKFLEREHVKYFRGSEKDMLKRFLDAAKIFETDIIIDVEGDKIYTDPFYVDKIADMLKNSNLDFVIGNDSQTEFNPADHFIHGFIPAGIRINAIEKICKLKKSKNTETGYREFFTSTNLFSIKYIKPEIIPTFSKNIRLTLDYQEDLDLANLIFKELGTHFHLLDLVKLFERKPELMKITEPIITKWKNDYSKKITDLSLKEAR